MDQLVHSRVVVRRRCGCSLFKQAGSAPVSRRPSLAQLFPQAS